MFPDQKYVMPGGVIIYSPAGTFGGNPSILYFFKVKDKLSFNPVYLLFFVFCSSLGSSDYQKAKLGFVCTQYIFINYEYFVPGTLYFSPFSDPPLSVDILILQKCSTQLTANIDFKCQFSNDWCKPNIVPVDMCRNYSITTVFSNIFIHFE